MGPTSSSADASQAGMSRLGGPKESGAESERPPTSSGAGTSHGGAKKKDGKKDKEKPKDVSSAVLFQRARERLQEAAISDQKALEVYSSFERVLGAALKKKGMKIPELLRDWDSEGKGEIKKIAFRQKVRGSLGIKANNSEIDNFFNSMDEDKGGSLDLAELKPALKFLLDSAYDAEAEAEALRRRAEECRAKAAQIEEAAKATEAAEKAEASVVELKSAITGPPAVQLGKIITSRNLKVSDIIIKWDPSNDGSVDKKEFRENVKELGVKASDDEIDALFDSLDEDGGGSLGAPELKLALVNLMNDAKAAVLQVADIEASSHALRKVASKLQQVLHTEEKAKVKAEKEAKEAAEREAASKAEQEREVVEEKKKERLVAAMKKAEEKAAFEAKIVARRNNKEAADSGLAPMQELEA